MHLMRTSHNEGERGAKVGLDDSVLHEECGMKSAFL